jgi:hypothetical protein
MNSALKPPGPLRADATGWAEFKFAFDLYVKAAEIDVKSTTLVPLLLHAAGVELQKIWPTLGLTLETCKLEEALAAVSNHFEPYRNEVYETFVFSKRDQADGETADDWIVAIKMQAQRCNFGDFQERMLRDRIVHGCSNDRVRKALLQDGTLSLAKAIQTVKAAEVTDMQALTMCGETANHNANRLSAVQQAVRSDTSSDQNVARVASRFSTDGRQLCSNCGTRHQFRNNCPARGARCYKCSRIGHYGGVCRTTRPVNSVFNNGHKVASTGFGSAATLNSRDLSPLPRSNEESQSSRELQPVRSALDADTRFGTNMFIGALSGGGNHDEMWYVKARVNGVCLTLLVDTGAACNVICSREFKRLSRNSQLRPVSTKVTAYNGELLSIVGQFDATFEIANRSTRTKFLVIDKDAATILGLALAEEMGIVKRSVNHVNITTNNSDVFSGLGCIRGVTHTIRLRPDAIPRVHPARTVPHAVRDKLKETLDEMTAMGVVTKQGEPTDWVNSLVIIHKKDGSLRLCIDPRDLNKAIRREHYQFPTIDEIIGQLSDSCVFSALDATSGFWNIVLDDDSSLLTTFQTPFGRYRFLRLPFGICSAPEVFHKTVAEMFADIPGVIVYIDDILVHAPSQTEHDQILERVIQRCRERGLKLNANKCQFSKQELKYLGHIIGKEGVRADPAKVEAIAAMPKPSDVAGLRRFLGMAQYMAKFVPNYAAIAAPLREMTQKEVIFEWTGPCDKSFSELKGLLSAAPVLSLYDSKASLTVTCDASREGLGAVLQQRNSSGELRPIAFASRSLTASEKNYAMIELECLAVVFACERFRQYVFGRSFDVFTDHRPLVPIFSKPLQQTPLRVQRLLLRLQPYDFTIHYQSGSSDGHITADTLSREPLDGQSTTDNDVDDHVLFVIRAMPTAVNHQLRNIGEVSSTDHVLAQVSNFVRNGWPTIVASEIKPYKAIHDEISIIENCLMKGTRVIIPQQLRREFLSRLHAGHAGLNSTLALARESVYWPGMNSDITNVVTNCSKCIEHRPNNAEPLIVRPTPSLPWQELTADFFHFRGENYLLIVDRYSRFPEIAKVTSSTAEMVIVQFKSVFARHGIPETLLTDNGPPFSSLAFRQFAKAWGFRHDTSSPRYPQSNGMAERYVQTVKRMLEKSNDPYEALMNYRATPNQTTGKSPAQLLFSRRLRTRLAACDRLLAPEMQTVNESAKRQKMADDFDRRHRSRALPELRLTDKVYIEDLRCYGTISKVLPWRSFEVYCTNGRTYRRNRRALRASPDHNDRGIIDEEDYEMLTATAEEPHVPVELDQPTSVVPRRSTRYKRQTEFYRPHH